MDNDNTFGARLAPNGTRGRRTRALVCVTVYKRGAEEVVRLLAG